MNRLKQRTLGCSGLIFSSLNRHVNLKPCHKKYFSRSQFYASDMVVLHKSVIKKMFLVNKSVLKCSCSLLQAAYWVWVAWRDDYNPVDVLHEHFKVQTLHLISTAEWSLTIELKLGWNVDTVSSAVDISVRCLALLC